MDERMLQAHVAFELGRWDPPALRATLVEEVDAGYGWAATATLGDVLDPDQVTARLQRLVASASLSDAAAQEVVRVAEAVLDALADDDTRVAELVDAPARARVADALLAMPSVREEIVDQVTTSPVYSRLVGHVLYRGIKDYALTENVVARKVPGAGSLLRLGQSALSSAAPSLGGAVERQLAAFVDANVASAIADSRRYLDEVLDDAALRDLGEQIWADNAGRTVADVVALVDAGAPEAVVAAARTVWERLRAAPPVQDLLAAAVEAVFEGAGDRTLAELLAEAGLDRDRVVAEVVPALEPLAEAARRTGWLEARLRARLGAFYAAYADAAYADAAGADAAGADDADAGGVGASGAR